MLKVLYFKVAPLLVPLFVLTTIVFLGMCVYRGEIILGLQAELIKDKNQEVKVIIEQHERATQISAAYEDRKAAREQDKVNATHSIEKVISDSGNESICFDNAWLYALNSQIATFNGASEPSSSMSRTTGAN